MFLSTLMLYINRIQSIKNTTIYISTRVKPGCPLRGQALSWTRHERFVPPTIPQTLSLFFKIIIIIAFFFFFFFLSPFRHVDIYTYIRHTHKCKVNMYRLCNGVNEKGHTKIVRAKLYKQSYRQTLTTTTTNKQKTNKYSNWSYLASNPCWERETDKETQRERERK